MIYLIRAYFMKIGEWQDKYNAKHCHGARTMGMGIGNQRICDKSTNQGLKENSDM